VEGKCCWGPEKPMWTLVYQYRTESNDGDIAWRIMHNIIVTPQRLHQWKRRKQEDCPWCIEHTCMLKPCGNG
jgi:hypothetical protein